MARAVNTSIDPLLGFAYGSNDLPKRPNENRVPGFVVYGKQNEGSDKAFRVVTLGGSTTGPLFEWNWPRQLYDQLDTMGVDAVIFNGGVNGYSSNQELLKLLRDVLPLEPHIVVSFTGINDLGFLHAMQRHPMLHPYIDQIMKRVLRQQPSTRNSAGVISEVHYGQPVSVRPAEHWIRNLRLMQAICSEFGVRFLGLLQPTLGVGDYEMNDEEAQMLTDYDQQHRGKYLVECKEFYREALDLVKKCDYIENMVDVFRTQSAVYYDCRHPNRRGYEIIASEVIRRVQSKGFFS